MNNKGADQASCISRLICAFIEAIDLKSRFSHDKDQKTMIW